MVGYGGVLCRNHPDVLSVLVEKGHLDVNMANFQQLTPLHVAVHKGHVECVKRLVAYRCDVNVTVITYHTCLLYYNYQHCCLYYNF